MGIGTSIFLIAVGAILRYAVNADISGLEISTVGLILMIAGVLGLLISLLYMTLWSRGRTAAPAAGERTVVRDRGMY
jgi:hypothetical protein